MSPVSFGGVCFANKKDAKKYLNDLRDRASEEILPGSKDFLLLQALLRRHPNAVVKIGIGIHSFFVDDSPCGRSGRCFNLRRLDNTTTDFSIKECLKSEKRKDNQASKEKVYKALRDVVQADMDAYKKKHFDLGDVYCAVTKKKLMHAECHVDHEYPHTFEILCMKFVGDFDAFYDTKLVHVDNSICSVKKPVADAFLAYHRQYARLRLVQDKVNCSLSYSQSLRAIC